MKWFITDMDGTFLNDKKEVAPNARDVIVQLQDKGSKFIIAKLKKLTPSLICFKN